MGGWITMVQYCSSGFRPCPTVSTMLPRPATVTWNGLSRKVIRKRKKLKVADMMPTTQGIMSRNLCRVLKTTTAAYVDNSHDHNSSEPSWPPHHAVNL